MDSMIYLVMGGCYYESSIPIKAFFKKEDAESFSTTHPCRDKSNEDTDDEYWEYEFDYLSIKEMNIR